MKAHATPRVPGEGCAQGSGESRLSAPLILSEAWCEWIKGQDWRWFSTLTFSRDVEDRWADKAFRRWHRLISRHALGVRRSWRERDGVPCLRAGERGTNGRVHYHVLVGPCGCCDFGALRSGWTLASTGPLVKRGNPPKEVPLFPGGYSRHFPFRPAGGAERYCAKYVVKGAELDCFGDWITWGGPRARPLIPTPMKSAGSHARPSRVRTTEAFPEIPEPYRTDTLRYYVRLDGGWMPREGELLPCQ